MKLKCVNVLLCVMSYTLCIGLVSWDLFAQEKSELQEGKSFRTEGACVEIKNLESEKWLSGAKKRAVFLGYGFVYNTEAMTVASGDFCTFNATDSMLLSMSFSLQGLMVIPANGAASGTYQIQFYVKGSPVIATDKLSFSVIVNGEVVPLTICSGVQVDVQDANKQIASGYALVTVGSGSSISLRNDTASSVVLSAMNTSTGKAINNAYIRVFQVS